MSKLLFIYERNMPTISITRDMFSNLHNHDEIKSSFRYLTDVKPSDIDSHDVIIFMRPNNIYSWKIANEAKKAGHVTVTFCDDDLLNLPVSSPTMPWRKEGLLRVLEHSDVIWSSSRYIAEKYGALTAGKRTAITDTILRPEELDGIKVACNEKVRIVYAAAPSHAALFEKYIAPIIPELTNEFDISLTFVGVHPNVQGIDCEYVSSMPLLEYRKYMRESGFDIGLAPLHDDEFSKCKYFNKYIEYTTQGIVGIYAKTEPYTYVVRDGINGFLASDNPQDWLRGLRKAIQDREKRKECVENAIQHLKNEHSEDACIERIRQGLPEILEASGNYKKCGGFGLQKVRYYITRPWDWIYLTGFYLKHTGIKAVIKRTKTHFVEAKAYSRRDQN
ncbi:MAG: glycosyltransferase [Oribacterium sp.]|nr:glycosyltransferase [Lachnospiraceae bacterium]MBP3805444.1 glycosyltransferase [Oribacterium sp.]